MIENIRQFVLTKDFIFSLIVLGFILVVALQPLLKEQEHVLER